MYTRPPTFLTVAVPAVHFFPLVPVLQRVDHSPSRGVSIILAVAFATHCSAFGSFSPPARVTLVANAFTSSPSGSGTSRTLNGFGAVLLVTSDFLDDLVSSPFRSSAWAFAASARALWIS